MNRPFSNLVITRLIVLFLVFAPPFRLFASGGIPQIELSTSQASTGATIEVAGGRFEAILATSCDTGTDDDEESDQRGGDEPLLAPMPTQIPVIGNSTAAFSATTTILRPAAEVEPPVPIS